MSILGRRNKEAQCRLGLFDCGSTIHQDKGIQDEERDWRERLNIPLWSFEFEVFRNCYREMMPYSKLDMPFGNKEKSWDGDIDLKVINTG